MLILFGCAHTVHTTLCFVSIQAHQFRFFISFALAHAHVLTKKPCESILHNLRTLLLLTSAAYACHFSLTWIKLIVEQKVVFEGVQGTQMCSGEQLLSYKGLFKQTAAAHGFRMKG